MAKILAVDDEANILKLVSIMLTRAGHEVRTASGPTEGNKILETFVPDLIVSDVNMQPISGLMWLQELRTSERFAHLQVIFLSAQSQTHEIRRGMNMGADDYLTKPFTQEDLLEAVDARLRRMGTAVAADSGLEVLGLGTAKVLQDGETVSWVSRKALELFFYLLEHKEAESWAAAEALWPEKDESRASSLFHTTLHRLRKSLGSEAVVSNNRRYSLSEDLKPKYDVERYSLMAKQAGGLSLSELRDVVAMYQEFMPGSDGEWVEEVRARLEELQQGVLTVAATAATAEGEYAAAVKFLQGVIDIDPLSDKHWEDLVRALEDSGDHQKAEMSRSRDMWWNEDSF